MLNIIAFVIITYMNSECVQKKWFSKEYSSAIDSIL